MTAATAPSRDYIWAPQSGPQHALIDAGKPEYFIDEVLFGGARGGGKGQALDAQVLTPFGWREMGSLKSGSAVCSPDGTVSQVIGIYPLGRRQLYRVTFHDGTSTEVTDDHIWLAWRSNKSRKIGNVRTSGESSARLWTTSQMRELVGGKRRFTIPVTDPIVQTDAARYPRRPVNPYLLGVLLGDGALCNDYLRITCQDREVIDRIEHQTGEKLHGPYQYPDRVAEWRLNTSGREGKHLAKWGLIGCASHQKFIPSPYLKGTIKERWELLRGMMDTDGWADADGDTYYATTSECLRDDVAALARSLGAVVFLREKEPWCTINGERRNGATAYTLRIKLRDGSQAFSLTRKSELASRSPQSMGRIVVSIEPTRAAEAQCIKVSHPSGLYITNDYIVTHNTDGMLGEFALHQAQYGKHARAMMIRRSLPQLDEAIERSQQIFGALGAEYNVQKKTWRFPNGAIFRFRAIERDRDAEKFQGHQYTRLYWEELTNFPDPKPYLKMMATLRSAAGVPCGVRATANPGGPGHNWVKARFIDVAPPYKPIREQSAGSTMTRVFIPARLEHNPALERQDPRYRARLHQMGHADLVRAWLEGDWDVVAGGMFDDLWRRDIHVVQPFEIPKSWSIYRSFDWGSSKPFSVGWWAESDGTGKPTVPRGTAFRIGEWYGCGEHPNEGIMLSDAKIGAGIVEAEERMGIRERVEPGPADASIFDRSNNGDCPADALEEQGATFFPSDKSPGSRERGVAVIRRRLEASTHRPMEEPGLFIFDTCTDFIRTFPTLPRDERKPDDVDTDAEDHAFDEARYMLTWMRPIEDTSDSGGFWVA